MPPTTGDIARRIARYRSSGDASDLWPDVPAGHFAAAQRAIADVTAAVLAGRAPAELALPGGMRAEAAGVAGLATGMAPLLGLWCEQGVVSAAPALSALLAEHLRHARGRAARLGRELDAVLAAFAARGVEAMALKGTHVAHVYYAEPAARPRADLDLLVRAADVAPAAEALAQLGFAAEPGPPQRTTWRRPGADLVPSLELVHEDSAWAVDLHVSLDRDPFMGIPMPRVVPHLAAAPELRRFARPVRVLPPAWLLWHLAVHTSWDLSRMLLIRLVDIVLVARADFTHDESRWDGMLAIAERTRTQRYLYPALAVAERLAPGTVPGFALGTAERAAPASLRRAVGRIMPGSAVRLHPSPRLESLVWARTPRELAAALGEWLWPRDVRGHRSGLRNVAALYRRRGARLLAGLARRR